MFSDFNFSNSSQKYTWLELLKLKPENTVLKQNLGFFA